MAGSKKETALEVSFAGSCVLNRELTTRAEVF